MYGWMDGRTDGHSAKTPPQATQSAAPQPPQGLGKTKRNETKRNETKNENKNACTYVRTYVRTYARTYVRTYR